MRQVNTNIPVTCFLTSDVFSLHYSFILLLLEAFNVRKSESSLCCQQMLLLTDHCISLFYIKYTPILYTRLNLKKPKTQLISECEMYLRIAGTQNKFQKSGFQTGLVRTYVISWIRFHNY